MDIIHIVCNTHLLNMGVWNSSLLGKDELLRLGANSYFWTCEEDIESPHQDFKFLDLKETSASQFISGISKIFNKESTLFITHGSWLAPSRIGFYASKAGFKWLYVPHGMLEPWSMTQNPLFKRIYYKFFESRYIKAASAIRAVSQPERERLAKVLDKSVFYCPNAVPRVLEDSYSKPITPLNYLFIARLHRKKGIFPLVKAWDKVMKGNPSVRLCIAGLDEGELEKIKPYFGSNLLYYGAVYDQDKIQLLKDAHYFILPSYSEGFPTSVLEAMSYGAIPLISKGCNFLEVFDQNLGLPAEPIVSQLESLLEKLKEISFDSEKSHANADWILQNYTEEKVANELFVQYSNLVKI